jgi:hypothetical protein
MYLGATVVYTAPSVLRMTGPSPVASGGRPSTGILPVGRPVPVNVTPVLFRPAVPTLAPTRPSAGATTPTLAPSGSGSTPSDSGMAPVAPPPQVIYAGSGAGTDASAGTDTSASAPATTPTDYTPLLIAGGLLAALVMLTR